jgi:ABC-type multidrug transport system fused ATPase/permease subunit
MPEVELPSHKELEELREKGFTKRVALITAIFAVILAIASLGGNKAMKEMLLAQQQASDQWAFYQAKVIREHLYRSHKMRLEADLIERAASMKPEARERTEATLKKMAEEEARYNLEKKEIEKEAKKLEKERDFYRSKDPFFEFAEVLLQIAIVMSSISILATSRRVFYFAIVAAILGAFFALNGFFLIVQIPLFH